MTALGAAPAPTLAPASGIRTQAELDRRVRAGLDALEARIRTVAADVPADRWGTRRADGGWSIGELFEHLCLANGDYLVGMRALAGAGGPPRASDDWWRPSLMGGLLRRALESPRPMRAPRAIQPGPTPRPDVDGALIATWAETRALMTRAAGLDWRRLRMSSPWARIVRLNFGDACLLTLRHGERHVGQAERLAARLAAASVAVPGGR